jgi:ABC-2 type transport system permease protein
MTASMPSPSSPPPPPLSERVRVPRRQVPSGTAFGLLYRTFIRSVRTTGRIAALVVLAALAVLAGAISSAAVGDPLTAGAGHAVFSLSLVVAIAALVVASAVLGDLYDNGSIVYVALRPVPSRVVAAAAWAASCTLVLPVAVVATLSVGLVHGGDGLLSATAIAALLGVAAYCALFVFIGVLVRRALPLGLAYLLLWEGFVSLAGDVGAAVSITGYLRSILAEVTGADIEFAPFTLAAGIIVPASFTVVAIAATGWLLDRRELP